MNHKIDTIHYFKALKLKNNDVQTNNYFPGNSLID